MDHTSLLGPWVIQQNKKVSICRTCTSLNVRNLISLYSLGCDSYPILVATEASFAHVRDTLLKSVYPDHSHSTDVTSYKVPDNLNRGYWTPETISTLGIERFRPNIIVGDAPSSSTPSLTAFEEDTWASLEVLPSSAGEAGFGEEVEGKGNGIYTLVRCGRCMVPNIDPATGIRDAFVSCH